MGLDGSVFFSQASRNQGVNICPQPRENANKPNVKSPDPFIQTLLRFLSWATLIAKDWLEMKQSKTRCFALVEKVRELKRWVDTMSFCPIVARKSNPARSQGDSGGSLTVEMDGAHILAGITSFALSDSKVDLNEIATFNKFSRIYLMCTPVSHLSCPGLTPRFSPTEDFLLVASLSLLFQVKVTLILLSAW